MPDGDHLPPIDPTLLDCRECKQGNHFTCYARWGDLAWCPCPCPWVGPFADPAQPSSIEGD